MDARLAHAGGGPPSENRQDADVSRVDRARPRPTAMEGHARKTAWHDADGSREASAASSLDLRIKELEFSAGVFDFHLPIDATLTRIGVGGPGRQFRLQLRQGSEPSSRDALPCQRAEFVLGDVQPTAVLRRLAEVKSPHDRSSSRRRKSLVKRADGVGIEVVAHDRHH